MSDLYLEMWIFKKKSFYLDHNELLLKGFSIRELLPEAHVDGVLRRTALVLLKLLKL